MQYFKRKSIKIKNLKKFKNKKFNLNKFVNDYYMDKNIAYITVKVDDYNDIVSKYSVSNYEWINQEFSEHLEFIAYYIPVDEPIVIEIGGKKFTEEEKIVIEKVIKTYFGLKLGDTILRLHHNRIKYLILLVFGMASFVMFYTLYKLNIMATLLELVVFGFWFIMWEFADLAFLQRSDLKTEKLEAGQLSSASITFIE
jgi:hypothetical protein